jgi:cell division protein ZapE
MLKINSSIILDMGQHHALSQFDRLYQTLATQKRTWLQKTPKGIYCWGGVGRGKTLLMDLFFNHLTLQKKQRLHFHAFMRQIHAKLHEQKGQKNPLRLIAKNWAKNTQVLCLDEMMVDDVADAMILAQLLEALHEAGVILVFTSNTAPDNLYKNGVQRQRFLPAIDLIKSKTEVVFIGEGVDYRSKILSESGTFFTPLNEENAARIKNEFELLTQGVYENNKNLLINDHVFITQACSEHIAWFSFHELCEKPRAYPDYLALSEQFKALFVTDMPICAARDDAAVKRFIHLIDVLYDAKITLILSAAAAIPDLYQGKSLKKEFERTQSRLVEMQFALSKVRIS